MPSIISASRKPIALISTHLSLIVHCIRKRTPSPTRFILFQITRTINMLRASTYSKTQNEEEQVDREISSCGYGATTAFLSLARYSRDKARQTIGATTNTDTKQALCGMALSSRYHRFLNPNSGTIDLFFCHVGPNRHFPWRTRRYIPTSESLRLCSR